MAGPSACGDRSCEETPGDRLHAAQRCVQAYNMPIRIDRRPGQVSDAVVVAVVLRPVGGLPPLAHRSGPSQVHRVSSRAAAPRERLSSDSSSAWRLLCIRVRPVLAPQRLESDSHGCSSAVHGCLSGAVSSPHPHLPVWRRLFLSSSGGGALLVRSQFRDAGESSSLHETHAGPGQVLAEAYDCRRDLFGRSSLRCGRLSFFCTARARFRGADPTTDRPYSEPYQCSTKGQFAEPSQVLHDHLGYEVNLTRNLICIPERRCAKIRSLALALLREARRHQCLVPTQLLRQFTGTTCSTSRAVRTARFHPRSLYDCTHLAGPRSRLSRPALYDLQFWAEFTFE